jgi:hypothetical protein
MTLHPLSTLPPQRLTWLRVVLSDKVGPDANHVLRRRLTAHLRHSGMACISSASRIAVLLRTNDPMTRFELSAVVDWLIEQPEVVLVRRETAPAKHTQPLRRIHG